MKQSLASIPGPLRYSRASGSVVLWCVSLERFLPRKSTGALPPAAHRPAIGHAAAIRRFLRLEALHRSPRLDQRAVDREVLARQQSLDPRLGQHRGQKLAGDLAVQQRSRFLEKTE